jgi:large subunit ribosomal protein L17
MANMASALIEHKRIQTTLAKAKALRQYLEPMVTKAKSNTTHSRRVVFSYLQNKYAVQELFDNIAGKVADRPGGYLRIVRIGVRQGDGSEMALIEFVDYNDTYVVEKKARVGDKKKRTRRGKKKAEGSESGPAEKVQAAANEAAAEGIAEVEEVVEDQAEDSVEDVVAEAEEPSADEAAEGTEENKEEDTTT